MKEGLTWSKSVVGAWACNLEGRPPKGTDPPKPAAAAASGMPCCWYPACDVTPTPDPDRRGCIIGMGDQTDSDVLHNVT
jgi:hypothetical protein